MDEPPIFQPEVPVEQRIRAALRQRGRALLSDVDGTLSAIAPTPEAAVLLPDVRPLLEQARAAFDVVAAISGRAARDAARMVGVEGITYVGNHGMEWLEPDPAYPGGSPRLRVLPGAEPYIAAVNATLDAVERDLAPSLRGLRVERKGVTGSLHVRGTRDPAQAEAALLRLLATLPEASGLRITRGKMVVEVRPPVEAHKGVAVAELIRTHGVRGALYLGDDRTDLDAFATLRQLSQSGACVGVAVAVWQAEAPPELAAAADLILPAIDAVPGFLRWLLAAAGQERPGANRWSEEHTR
jgi:trehalose 6-phosphate phosphatase